MSHPGPPQPGASAPAAGAPGPPGGTPQQLNQIVIEYLSKKGYSKTEAMLRMESAHTDAEGRPINSKPEDNPDTMYERAYMHLIRWIDNSLEIYKPELRRLAYPVFVHFYLNMLSQGYVNPAKAFWTKHHEEHGTKHSHDLKELGALTLPAHATENQLAKLYRESKYRISLSKTTGGLVIVFLEETEDQGGKLVLDVINRYVDIRTVAGRAGMFSRDEDATEDEGILGHVSGSQASVTDVLRAVKLGPLPMDRELAKEVEDELQEEDAKMRDVSRGGSLLEEFQRIKREEMEDSPMRDAVPLPPYTVTDVEREVQLVKEQREAVKIHGGPSPALPSVCMYTFHNTNDGLHTVQFSDDATLAACGFAESYVRVFSLKGTPLESIIPSENEPTIPKSRRLIGHSGPVYGTSFSPDAKYLLSCSEDKSARLWSLNTYTALVVYKGHDAPIWDVEFGPFGHYFATASHEHTARLWSCDHIYPLRIFAGHLSDVDTLAWHPNSAYLFTGSSDKTARMWDIQTGNAARLFHGHTAPVTALAVSPDGKYLATAAEDSLINIWDIAAGKRLKSMKGHGKTSIYSLSFSREGSVLVSGGADMTVRCWDVMHGTGIGNVDAPESLQANGTVSLGDGTTKVDGTGQSSGGAKRKGGRDVLATPDHLAVWHTKKSPVYKVQFTRKNMVLAGAAFLP
ncbi:WD40 repeat-like protein [Ascodesmis nigricans]|uniref:WD40 repeat-like protein n=1 Tax=Ascodesmis nigricans TaxID=341454 RepID=A0A4S2N2N4_9PEZI|nr:WD40 repeat-like protein [Ascodesmis nigricans]